MNKIIDLSDNSRLENAELGIIKKEWEDLRSSFLDAVRKDMYTYMDSDLNAMAVFLRKHRKYVPDEVFDGAIVLMNDLVKEIWRAAHMGASLKTQLSISFTTNRSLLD